MNSFFLHVLNNFLKYSISSICTLLSAIAQRIPFATIHKCDLPFTSTKRKCFQPGQRVTVKVTDIEVPDSGRLINPNV